MIQSLRQQPDLKAIPIHLKIEYITLDSRTPGIVKAIHIYTEYDKAFECKNALAKLYTASNSKNYLMGKNIRFIPDMTDSRFITKEKTRMKVKGCMAKQKLFLANASTGKNYTILGLDYFILQVGFTMREAIMGIKSRSQEHCNLFLAVDRQAMSNTVVFVYHNDLVSEANIVISALPVILEAQYGDYI